MKVGEFEGPLDLLLDLIEKRKLHISNVSLSQVADEFTAYTKSFEDFPIGDSADFILVASTLLLIKSKSLLPTIDLTPEEQVSIEDLEARLALYKKYKDLSVGLGKMFGNFLYFAKEKKQKMVVFAPTPDISLSSLKNTLSEMLQNIPKIENLSKVMVQKIISLEEMVEKLSERIRSSISTSFSDFAGIGKTGGLAHSNFSGQAISPQARVNVIVSFLAMLELVKQGLVRVNQDRQFEDIRMESDKVSTPAYL